jgi:uncharacterized lipoprotein YddW (UPF0748 family)
MLHRFRQIRTGFALSAFAVFASMATPRHLAVPPSAPPVVPREFRAAWMTPIWDRGFRDWPSSPNMTPDEQRAELRRTLDQAVAVGLNTVIVHVRLAGDALYPTTYAPWSVFLTGKSGVGPQPPYDPLAFAIEEAHARGLQLHAWFNPFRAMLPQFAGKAAPSHVTRTHPEWIRKYGTQTWIDPGDPAARQFVLATILDVVKRYDLDGVHLDDYFYPYRETETIVHRFRRKRSREVREIPFPDDKTWKKFGRNEGYKDRDAWRRDNIDQFIEALYKDVKAIKPTVLVGLSPFGIWRPGNPPGITGLDAFAEIYADSRRWLQNGWVDYLVPQLYWELDGAQDRFRALDAWWRRENVRGRHIWPGLYTSHVYGGRDVWPMGEIARQVEAIRESRIGSSAVPGHVHFRLAALFADNFRLASTLAGDYRERALVPAFPWLDARVPAAPQVSLVAGDGATNFTVAPGDTARVRWWLIQTRGRNGNWTTNLREAGEGKLSAAALGTSDPDEVAVSAVSPTGVSSAPTIVLP